MLTLKFVSVFLDRRYFYIKFLYLFLALTMGWAYIFIDFFIVQIKLNNEPKSYLHFVNENNHAANKTNSTKVK